MSQYTREEVIEKVIKGESLADADLSEIDLSEVDFSSKDLGGDDANADFGKANLMNANFSESILCFANFREATLNSANFQKADLLGANFQEANLKTANFKEANLDGANLMGANLITADFQNARLQEASLQGANLLLTNLTQANLRGAILDNAIFKSTIIDSAIFKGASINRIRDCSKETLEYLIHLGAKKDNPEYEQEREKLAAQLENTQLKLKAAEEENKPIIATAIPANPVWQERNFTVDLMLCFIIMPFSNKPIQNKQIQYVYNTHTKKIVENDFKLKCVRADDIFKPKKMIMENIWENICRARFLIADLTGRNSNVFYELGIAHTLGKEVILITQDEQDVPFDLRHLTYLKYEYSRPGMIKFKRALKQAIESILKEDMAA